MTRPYISLNLNGLTLTLDHFASGRFPRIQPQTSDPETSATGALNVFGYFHENPHLWEFSARISHADRDKLNAIYSEHLYLRRSFGNYKIILTDCTQPFVERSPRTRGIAPSPFNTELANTPYTGFVQYFATYKVVFSGNPEYGVEGRFDVVNLAFREAEDKTTP